MRAALRGSLSAALLLLAGCAADPPAQPEAPRHRCVEIPSGLVECMLLPPERRGVSP